MNRQQRYAKLRGKLAKAESDLLRATRKWDKLRQQVKRAEAALDKEFRARSEIGGAYDFRDPLINPIERQQP